MKKIYKIMASSRYGKEEIDTAETLQEAKYLLNEYRLAYGPEFIEQKNAWDKFAALKDFEILTLPTGQGLIIRNK